MRILHTSNTGLPDPRIEKTALIMKRHGHDVVFLGGQPARRQDFHTFEETHYLPFVSTLRYALDPRFRRRWLRAIDEIRPDVVHAHNITAAVPMLDSDYPTIYDDHEFWSRQVFRYRARGFLRRMAATPFARKLKQWERLLLERYPVLTTSDNIANEHRKIASFVGVTWNYPLRAEVEGLHPSGNREGFVYVGGDFRLRKFLPHRDMTGLDRVIQFDIISGLPHSEMMNRLLKYRFGLTPWRQHPIHKYCSPNRNYEYLHAGLPVIITDSLAHHLKGDPFVYPFSSYDEIPKVAEAASDADPERIMEHARKKYVWDDQEPVILEAYREAMKR